jgi:hypothetical protein
MSIIRDRALALSHQQEAVPGLPISYDSAINTGPADALETSPRAYIFVQSGASYRRHTPRSEHGPIL